MGQPGSGGPYDVDAYLDQVIGGANGKVIAEIKDRFREKIERGDFPWLSFDPNSLPNQFLVLVEGDGTSSETGDATKSGHVDLVFSERVPAAAKQDQNPDKNTEFAGRFSDWKLSPRAIKVLKAFHDADSHRLSYGKIEEISGLKSNVARAGAGELADRKLAMKIRDELILADDCIQLVAGD